MDRKDRGIKVGLLGLGCVGEGTAHILQSNGPSIINRAREPITVTKALVRDNSAQRRAAWKDIEITTDPDDVLTDPTIDIVVEVIGGIHPAKEYIEKALRQGKYVVTANKDLMAQHGFELLKIAKEQGRNIYYEASVAGGIPVLQPLKQSLAGNRISKVLGIINGTTNYIFTQMTQHGKDFDTALQEAQELGFAEQDPSSDIDGLDAAYKIAILASLAFQRQCDASQVYTESMRHIQVAEIEYAKTLGYVVKLLACAEKHGDAVALRVHPTLIPADHPLANIHDEFNAVFIHGDAVGEVMFYGKGAGSLPTGSAIVADIIEAARCLHYKIKNGVTEARFKPGPMADMADQQSSFYVRIQTLDQPGVFASIAVAFGDVGVSLDRIMQKPQGPGMSEIVLITHKVQESHFQKALAVIRQQAAIQKISAVIRVLEEGDQHAMAGADSALQSISTSN